MTKFLTIIQFLVYNNYEQSTSISIIYVNAPVNTGTVYIVLYELLHGYTSAVLSVITIKMNFVPKQHVLELDSISLVSKVPGHGFNIVHLLLD